jgi:hypothetical protein
MAEKIEFFAFFVIMAKEGVNGWRWGGEGEREAHLKQRKRDRREVEREWREK